MTAFDAALRSRANPDALSGGHGRIAAQGLLSADWGLGNTLAEANWNDALAGNVGGQWRVQEVHTPDWILDAVREALGGRIVVDPCAASNPEDWFAERNLTLAKEALALEHELTCLGKEPGTKKRRKELHALLKPFYKAGALNVSWGSVSDGTFGNVPFGFLEAWIRRFRKEGELGRPAIGLWPVRTHRRWWTAGHAGAEVVFLSYDVRFKGHKHAFPAPLCLAAWNCRIPDLKKRETARWSLAA